MLSNPACTLSAGSSEKRSLRSFGQDFHNRFQSHQQLPLFSLLLSALLTPEAKKMFVPLCSVPGKRVRLDNASFPFVGLFTESSQRGSSLPNSLAGSAPMAKQDGMPGRFPLNYHPWAPTSKVTLVITATWLILLHSTPV